MLEALLNVLKLLFSIAKGCFDNGFWYIPIGAIATLAIVIVKIFRHSRG